MLGFWIALGVVVAGFLTAMAYYAIKGRRPKQAALQFDAMNPRSPRSQNGHAHRGSGERASRRVRADRRAG
jgi:uncharacterized iron-regulated membrane protein